MKNSFLAVLALLSCTALGATDTLKVNSFRHAGPVQTVKPYMVDSTNIAKEKYSEAKILDAAMPLSALKGASTVASLPLGGAEGKQIHLAGFSLENRRYTKATVKVEGISEYRLYVDGKPAGGESKLEPGTHEVVLKYITGKEVKDSSAKVSVITKDASLLSLREDGKKIFSLDVNTDGETCGGVSISAGGKYIAITHRMIAQGGASSSYTEIIEAQSGKTIAHKNERVSWMPYGDQCWSLRANGQGKDLVVADPDGTNEKVLARNVPEGWFTISPDGKYLVYSLTQEGKKEGDVHQIIAPDDRQPGWRDRGYLAKYDLSAGFMQPLTFGWHNTYLNDISADGRHILFSVSSERITKRPTTLTSIYLMDIETLETECLVKDDGFIGGGSFSPDGKEVLISGSPEAFGGMGNELGKDAHGSMIQQELFVLTIADKSVRHITRDFPQNPGAKVWSAFDGKIYTVAEDKDCKQIFRIDPKDGNCEKLDNKEDYIYRIDLAQNTSTLVYYGQSLCNGDRVYALDTKKGKQTLLRDISASRLEDVTVGEGHEYEFTSRNGDLINGFYVLPPDFDPSKKYPLLVHYYGGCSPSTRYCIGSYSPQIYAAQGYVFYVINPSGATGFGQEFAARHVNTAGDVVADDIIEGTKKFCEDHPFINTDKIGCFSASYGGFMTQLLLSKTDIYATGISHAGISDHTSYWGEGYWGYTYSEVSMADSYPWTRKDLYVDRSPLYFADKIKNPLLFLHGSADTNVPIGESIQMFTALKILGNDTAFVVVDGENHGISDYGKRRQWLRTIFAWFSKHLQDDPTWWNELYPEQNL